MLFTGLSAKTALSSAASALAGAQSAILDGDVASAQISVQEASQETAKAHRQTSDIVWQAVSAVPWLGSPEGRDAVRRGRRPGGVRRAAEVRRGRPDAGRHHDQAADGSVDLARFAPVATQLAGAEQSMLAARDTMAGCRPAGARFRQRRRRPAQRQDRRGARPPASPRNCWRCCRRCSGSPAPSRTSWPSRARSRSAHRRFPGDVRADDGAGTASS